MKNILDQHVLNASKTEICTQVNVEMSTQVS